MYFFFFMSIFFMKIEMNNFNFFLSNLYIIMKNTMFIIVVSLIFLSIYIYSFYYLNSEKSFLYFIVVLLIFFLSMMILLMSKSILMLFLGWDGLGVSSFILVSFYKNWITLNNSILTFLSNRVGDSIFLLIFSFMIFKFNIFFFLSSILIIFLSITKSAQFPFMSWLPAAMAAPTPVSALVHSSTLVTAGVFLLILFKNFFFFLNLKLLFFISMMTIFGAGMSAFMETDFKKMVAFSTLSQIGFLFFMLSNNKFILSLFHLFSHAFFKSLLFMSIGSLLHSSLGNQESRNNLKTYYFNKNSLIFIYLSIFNLMGLMMLSGFWSKDLFLIFFSSMKSSNIFSLFMVFLISLTWLYNFKMLFFLNCFNKSLLKEISYLNVFPLLFLFILSLLFSLNYLENYIFFFENSLFLYENLIFILFLTINFFFFNFFLKKKKFNFFFLILNLMFMNNFFMKIFSMILKIQEKLIIDKIFINIFLFKIFNFKNYYFWSIIFLMFLIF